MSEGTAIEWTDATWNPVTGCSIVSPGCTNCYAMKLAGTRLQHHPSRAGLTKETNAGPVWTGDVRLNEEWLDQPLRWKKPRKIFVCAHGDLFHEGVPDEWIDKVFAVMALAPQHTFQVLTKRPQRMRDWFAEKWQAAPAQRYEYAGLPPLDMPAEHNGEDRRDQIAAAIEDILQAVPALGDTSNPALWDENDSLKALHFAWPLPNVWLGISCERQKEADERIPILLETPAAVRFISAEPLLGPIDLTWLVDGRDKNGDATSATVAIPNPKDPTKKRYLNWVIVGGESGKDARPMHPAWARSLRDQCVAAGVAFFFKQNGEFVDTLTPDDPRRQAPLHYTVELTRVGKKAAGRLLDGREWNEFPEAACHS